LLYILFRVASSNTSAVFDLLPNPKLLSCCCFFVNTALVYEYSTSLKMDTWLDFDFKWRSIELINPLIVVGSYSEPSFLVMPKINVQRRWFSSSWGMYSGNLASFFLTSKMT
jgi:hypothetical protein